MKTRILVLALVGMSALSLMGQTAVDPGLAVAPATNSATPPTNNTAAARSIIADLKQVGLDGYGALKDANFANGIVVEPFGIYHDGDFGGGLAITTGNTNGVNLGFALAAINDSAKKKWDFYDATLSISYGRTVDVPLLHIPAFLYIETGPAVNLAHPSDILVQSVAGAKIFLGSKQQWSIGGGVGQNSEWPDSPFYIGHVSLRF